MNVDQKYVKECLEVLKHQDCIFQKGITTKHDQIASLYSLRFQNAKETGKLSTDSLMDYKNCVDQLNKSKSDFLGITSIYSENFFFLIFYEPENKIILGVLKSNNQFGIKGIEEHRTDTINKGFSSNAEKYSNGLFIRDWK